MPKENQTVQDFEAALDAFPSNSENPMVRKQVQDIVQQAHMALQAIGFDQFYCFTGVEKEVLSGEGHGYNVYHGEARIGVQAAIWLINHMDPLRKVLFLLELKSVLRGGK